MRPITFSQTGPGTGKALPMNYFGRPEVALQVAVTGTVNYTVQQTLDDPADASATWLDHPDSNLVAATTSKQGNYAYCPRATRLVVNSGTGTAVLTIIQEGFN